MATNAQRIGWIGIGRMGSAMAERLAKGGADLTVWNRTRARAEPLAALGAKVAGKLVDLAACDIVFVMVSTWDDVQEVVAAPGGLLSGEHVPRLVVECSSISLEGSAELRALLAARDVQMLAAPVSGNAKVIKAGRLSFVCSGPKSAYDAALPWLKTFAPAELRRRRRAVADRQDLPQRPFSASSPSRLPRLLVLAARRRRVPRHARFDFMNQPVAIRLSRATRARRSSLDFKVPFTPKLPKDLDLGLMRRAASTCRRSPSITRDLVQSLIGHGMDEEGLRQADRPAGDGVGSGARTGRTRSTTALGRRSDERRGEPRRPAAWVTGGGSGIGLAARSSSRRRAASSSSRGATAPSSTRPSPPPRRAARRAGRSPRRRSTSPTPLLWRASRRRSRRATAASTSSSTAPASTCRSDSGTRPTARPRQRRRDQPERATACTLAVLHGMQRRRRGTVINVASFAGWYLGYLTGPAYTASRRR
jgi:3-hydroxyisobutyrate dehydrogenase